MTDFFIRPEKMNQRTWKERGIEIGRERDREIQKGKERKIDRERGSGR